MGQGGEAPACVFEVVDVESEGDGVFALLDAGEELFHPSEVGLDITPGPDLHQGDSQMM